MAELSTTRRAFLTGIAATASGCAGLDGGGDQPPTDTETGTPTDRETETTTEDNDTETPSENHPGTFLVDFVPAVDEELRQQLHGEVEHLKSERQAFIDYVANWYAKDQRAISPEQAQSMAQEQVDNILEISTPAFSEPEANELTESYSTEEEYDDIKYDSSALEHAHDNDYLNFTASQGTNPGVMAFVETIEDEELWPWARDTSNFQPDKFVGTGPDTDQFIDAFDQIHRFLWRFERRYTDGNGSEEDTQYMAMFQEAFDRYTDFETYFWEVETHGHGTGMVWNQQEDSLRVVESVSGKGPNNQMHPLVEDSDYISGEIGFWHPLRFAEEYRNNTIEDSAVSFRSGKSLANHMLHSISTASDDANEISYDRLTSTTGYTLDIVDSIRNYNSNAIEFSQLKQQAKAFNKLGREARENNKHYVLGGTVDDFYAVQVEDPEIVEAVRTDEERRYDDMRKVAEEAESIDGSVTLDDVNQILG